MVGLFGYKYYTSINHLFTNIIFCHDEWVRCLWSL